MRNFGFVKVAAAVPRVRIADCDYNSFEIVNLIKEADRMGAQLVVFPELSITAYTAQDLFHQQKLLDGAIFGLKTILEKTENMDIVSLVGCPMAIGNSLYNCAIVCQGGRILGIVPKANVPNYEEFYERRWFTPSDRITGDKVYMLGQDIDIGANLVFKDYDKGVCFAAELCEDLWAPVPPSTSHALFGATILFNLSCSNEIIGKHEYRNQLISQQSAKCISAYVYCSSGVGESTTDLVFGGYAGIYENGRVQASTERFMYEKQLICADIDVEMLKNLRARNSVFREFESESMCREVRCVLKELDNNSIKRKFVRNPFVPSEADRIKNHCEEIFNIQVTGLASRILHIGIKDLLIGVSGGLDSTLALLVAAKACDKLSIGRSHVHGVFMPGFGTSESTKNRARLLMKLLGVSANEIDITNACRLHFRDINQRESSHDTVFENAQARERMQILMDMANKLNGIVVGTSDMSELALGWTTYNGDHMSMYGVNCGVPKTLVKFLIKNIADNSEKRLADLLLDIFQAPITPELLPTAQKTEKILGPYELHDFFLYHMIRNGFSPRKILYLALRAFDGEYEEEFIRNCLRIFYTRFFENQFKRSCVPDGPKVGTVSLSPRGDWRMPSDASGNLWLEDLEE